MRNAVWLHLSGHQDRRPLELALAQPPQGPVRLREHVQLIYRSLAGRLQLLDPALFSGNLVGWVLEVQGRLEPLQTKTSYIDAHGDTVAPITSLDIFGDRKTPGTVAGSLRGRLEGHHDLGPVRRQDH